MARAFAENYGLQEMPLFVDDPQARSVRQTKQSQAGGSNSSSSSSNRSSMSSASSSFTLEAKCGEKEGAAAAATQAGESPEEEFEYHFAPWPLRFYVLLRGRVVSNHLSIEERVESTEGHSGKGHNAFDPIINICNTLS